MSCAKTVDVVVIGGGPGGSTAAALLAQRGFQVTLLEKEIFPRPSVGESVIPQFWRFCELSGAGQAIRDENFLQKGGAAVCWGGVWRRVSFSDAGFTQPALHVERDCFDNILLQNARTAGANIVESAQVIDVKCSETDATTTFRSKEGVFDIRSHFVVDASGQRAVIASRRKQREFIEGFNFQAFWGYFDRSNYIGAGGDTQEFSQRFTSKPLTMVCDLGGGGWFWHIVLREKVSVGLILPPDLLGQFKAGGADLSTRFEGYCRSHSVLGEFLRDSRLVSKVESVRDYSYQSQELAMERAFLIGDAAAFVDPISSEGIPLAMYGAYLASWAIEKCLNNPSRLEFYRQVYIDSYRKKLELFRMTSTPDRLLDDLSNVPELFKSLSDLELRLILSQTRLTGREKVHRALSEMRPDLSSFVQEFELRGHGFSN